MIDRLPAAEVEDGKEHPFVVALMKELRDKHAAAALAMESAGMTHDAVKWHAGRCATLREIVDMIGRAKGKDDE